MVTIFTDDDEGYVAWLHSNPEAIVLNAYTPPTQGYRTCISTTCRQSLSYLLATLSILLMLATYCRCQMGARLGRCEPA